MANLLLVEDHTLFREMLAHHLQNLQVGYHLFMASHGREALEIISSEKIDLVLLDVQMPIMGGIETLKALRQTKYRTKVIILTMLEDKSLISHMIDLGANGFLSKNSELEEMECAIENVLKCGKHVNSLVLEAVSMRELSPESQGSLSLSARELQILAQIMEGHKNAEIAVNLGLEVYTIVSYRKNLMQKTKTKNVADLVSFAIKAGLLH
jgi:DNA-binding NarL/FixJ family response regulator